MIKLAIYCRTSRDNGETHDSIETQTEIGIKYAIKNELPYEIYIDEGISGAGDFFKRTSFVKMVSEIDDNLISHVWVLDDSRLEREPSV
jgi:DNA invertase Pin-like site-specific DNA recombinase